MFGRIGVGELILILLIALVIFGPKKLPEIGKALGDAFRNFKKQTDKLGEDADRTPSPPIGPDPGQPPESVGKAGPDGAGSGGDETPPGPGLS